MLLPRERTRRFWTRFRLHFFAALGALGAVVQITAAIGVKVFSDRPLLTSMGLVAGAVTWAVLQCRTRSIVHKFSAGNTRVEVVPGDMFAQDCGIVVGMCTTFETRPPEIAPDSIQGQLLLRVFQGNADRLDSELTTALAATTAPTTGHSGRPAYPLGTVAVLDHTPNPYYCVAYTEMNDQDETRATVEGLVTSLGGLWEAVRRRSNGRLVAVGVLGGGQARLAQVLPAQDAIRLIALSYILATRRERIGEGLRIVVRPEVFDRLDTVELADFIASLSR